MGEVAQDKMVCIEITDEQRRIYNKLRMSPARVLKMLNKLFYNTLKQTENVYGSLTTIDEELIAEAVLEEAGLLKADRLQAQKESTRANEAMERMKVRD